LSYLGAAVALLGVLWLVMLVLMFALMRRMRELQERVAKLPRQQPGPPRLPVGAQVADFASPTADGGSVSLAELTAARSLVGFFSPNCSPCHDQVPAFAEFARTFPGGPTRVLAVITEDGGDVSDYRARLSDVASVVIEPRQGAVARAFSMAAYPMMYLVGDDGRIEAGGAAVRALTPLIPA
jgi:peroxiredoxin